MLALHAYLNHKTETDAVVDEVYHAPFLNYLIMLSKVK